MSRRHHLVCMVAFAGLAVWFLVAGWGGLAIVALALAMLVCPLAMGAVIWLVMREAKSKAPEREDVPGQLHARSGPQ